MADFIFLGSKIMVDSEGITILGPWKKSYDKPHSIFKSRDITSPTNIHIVIAMVFQVIMQSCMDIRVGP